MNPKQTHILKTATATWRVNVAEVPTHIDVMIESDPPGAVMTPAEREQFLFPILEPLEGRRVVLANPAFGWGISRPEGTLLSLKKKETGGQPD